MSRLDIAFHGPKLSRSKIFCFCFEWQLEVMFSRVHEPSSDSYIGRIVRDFLWAMMIDHVD